MSDPTFSSTDQSQQPNAFALLATVPRLSRQGPARGPRCSPSGRTIKTRRAADQPNHQRRQKRRAVKPDRAGVSRNDRSPRKRNYRHLTMHGRTPSACLSPFACKTKAQDKDRHPSAACRDALARFDTPCFGVFSCISTSTRPFVRSTPPLIPISMAHARSARPIRD